MSGTRVQLWLGTEHPCPYLPGRTARSLFVDPDFAPTPQQYATLLAQGFRRSGSHLYRPACQTCRSCLPLRIPLGSFRPDRSQRRALARNRDISTREAAGGFAAEHYALYRRYLGQRHAGSEMQQASQADYLDFLTSAWSDTLFLELRQEGRLMGVAVTDRVSDALSAVYTFFEPGEQRRSLGVYAILQQIAFGRELGCRWLYLGYWIAECDKMSYKNHYGPYEILTDRGWILHEGRSIGS